MSPFRHQDFFDGQSIRLADRPPPLYMRLMVAGVGALFLAIGIVSLINLISTWRAHPAVPTQAIGVLVTLGFTVIPLLLLLGALGMSARELRIDTRTGAATLTRRWLIGSARQTFPAQALRQVEVEYTPEAADSFAAYALRITLPDRSTLRYHPSLLPLTSQKAFCEQFAARIEDAMGVGRRGMRAPV